MERPASQPPQGLLVRFDTVHIHFIYSEPLTHAAPSAPPTSVGVSEVTSFSITVQWGPVDCIHRNGNIRGYSIQYGEKRSGNKQTLSVSGGDVTKATISGLNFSTTYSIQVAAVTSAGTGPYSDAITNETYQSE